MSKNWYDPKKQLESVEAETDGRVVLNAGARDRAFEDQNVEPVYAIRKQNPVTGFRYLDLYDEHGRLVANVITDVNIRWLRNRIPRWLLLAAIVLAALAVIVLL